MANILKNFLDSMKLSENDYDDFDDDFESNIKPKRRKENKNSELNEDINNTVIQSPQTTKKERAARMDRTSSKVVPMRATSKGLEVCIMKPTTFEESQEISDLLLSGKATVINLEGFDDKVAQRIMDFVSGCVYAINGKLHRISNCIFIVSPDNVDISGDYLDLIEQSGFEPPTFENRF